MSKEPKAAAEKAKQAEKALRTPYGRPAASYCYGKDYPACWMNHLGRPHDYKGE